MPKRYKVEQNSMGLIGQICSIGLVLGLGWWAYKVVYNLFFSPLKDIPGPLIMQIFPPYQLYLLATGIWPMVESSYYETYGDTVRTGWSSVNFASEEAFRKIYLGKGFPKSPKYSAFQVLEGNLFSLLDSDIHRKRKRIMTPAFSMPNVEALDPVIREHVTDVAVQKLKEREIFDLPVDMFEMFGQIAFDTIGLLGFGKSFGTIQNGIHEAEKLVNRIMPLCLLSGFLPIHPLVKVSPYVVRLRAITQDAIEDAKCRPNDKSILSSLIQSKDPETGESLSMVDLEEEAILQIVAGSESTGATMTWILYYLLRHPDIYQRVVDELIEKFPNKDGVITIADCKPGKLPFLEASIKETMRVETVAAASLLRVAPKGGAEIHGRFFPEGTEVSTNGLTMHTLPTIWGDDAKEYNPDRFIKMGDNIPVAYSPFSGGPRACIGRFLAIAEIRVTLATLLRKFDFCPESDAPLTPCCYIFTKPREGKYMCNVSARVK